MLEQVVLPSLLPPDSPPLVAVVEALLRAGTLLRDATPVPLADPMSLMSSSATSSSSSSSAGEHLLHAAAAHELRLLSSLLTKATVAAEQDVVAQAHS